MGNLMNIQEVNLSSLVNVFGRASYGYFGYRTASDLRDTIRWHKCREIFHSAVDASELKSKYWYATKVPESVVRLVDVVETILGVEKTKFSVHWNYLNLSPTSYFYTSIQTTYPDTYPNTINLLQVEPSKFWLQQNMRHSFFTCVLRAGLNWDMKRNPLKVLSEYQYFVNNKSVSNFLNGNTWYTGQAIGWHSAFSPGSVTNLYQIPNPEKNLVNPPVEAVKKRAYFVWEEWGKPVGREADIWRQAEKDIGVARD